MTQVYLLDVEFELNGEKQVLWPTVIQDDSDLILVDCGYPNFLQLIEEAAGRQGINLKDLTKLILTHHDMDHIGSAAEFRRKYPNVEICAHVAEFEYINGAKKSLRLMQAEDSLHGLIGTEKVNAEKFIQFLKSIEYVPVNRILQSDEFLPWCDGIEIIHTPGHTPGHISLYIPTCKTLIASDAIVIDDGKLNIANPQYCLDLNEAIKSVQRLQSYEVSRLICYHGGLYKGNLSEAFTQLIHEYQ